MTQPGIVRAVLGRWSVADRPDITFTSFLKNLEPASWMLSEDTTSHSVSLRVGFALGRRMAMRMRARVIVDEPARVWEACSHKVLKAPHIMEGANSGDVGFVLDI